MRALARALRVHQWAKNLLVLVPLLTSHRILDSHSAALALFAFAAFCLTASAVYLGNDLVDLEEDRLHPSKRLRPLASGELSVPMAWGLIPALLIGAASVALLTLPWQFGAMLAAYVAANFAYSFALKRVAIVDVFTLAGLYTLRILAGAAAIGVPVSHWLLAFSLFAFLSLACAKRFVEVANAPRKEGNIAGRGYSAGDGALLGSFGTASGCISVLVFALYITSGDVVALYRSPAILWFAVPLLLYWIARVWLYAYRGTLHEDPVIFALRDIPSYVTAAAILAVMLAAT